jgi:hypothetical protein
MMRDLDEATIYERIIESWEQADLSDEDADQWLSENVLNILDEDRHRNRPKKDTVARIVSNCLILVLALTTKKPVDLRGEFDVTELSCDQRERIMRDLASIAADL